jgi:hypothetical protein
MMLPCFIFASQVVFSASPGPLDNPYKGFASYTEIGHPFSAPVSMAYEYAAWNEIEPEEGHYAFEDWEKKWNSPQAKGKPVVIRVYADYPAEKRAIPQWLLDKGVKTTPYSEFGGGVSPDYENPVMIAALLRLIANLGARYDKDPRIAFVQLGLLGHWGEWHTYPRDELFASPQVQKKVVAAFHRAFPHKQLMARNGSYASCQVPWLGFHDDMIPDDTLGKDNWQFVPQLLGGKVADNWKVAPTGGEMVPGGAHRYLGADWPQLVAAVKAAHFSWIGPYCPPFESSLTPQETGRVDELIRMMGYEFRLIDATIPSELSATSTTPIRISAINQGVAPFYYPWPVRMALIDSSGSIFRQWTLPQDVRAWLPGSFSIDATAPAGVAPGKYSVGIGVFDPSNSSTYIKFANSLPLSNGYTVLGSVTVP